MKCVRTTRAHLTQIKPLPFHEVDNWVGTLDKPGTEDYLRTFCRTLMDGDEPIQIIGVQLQRPGVGEIWAVYSIYVEQHAMAVIRHLKEAEELGIKQLGLWRLSATCLVDFPPARCHLEGLGFICEGRLRSLLGPGIDCWLMAKVYE